MEDMGLNNRKYGDVDSDDDLVLLMGDGLLTQMIIDDGFEMVQ